MNRVLVFHRATSNGASGAQKQQRDNRVEKPCKEIRVKISPSLAENIIPWIQEAQQTSSRINTNTHLGTPYPKC